MQLTVFAVIIGVGAASGLYFKNDMIYLVGDNSAYLYQYRIKEQQLDKKQILFGLMEEQLANIPKANKPDFEVVSFYDHKLFVMGSGSTENRNTLIIYSLETKEIIEKDLSPVYERLREISSIDEENFNIEGAVFTGSEWMLFNRGNGPLSQNGIFKIPDLNFDLKAAMSFTPVDLPEINDVASSFTDAVLVGNEVFFLATAEETASTYEDGEVAGSLIGSLDVKTLKVNFTKNISDRHKFEGITVYKQTAAEIEFLLCEDKDNEELVSAIYKLSLPKE